jgi:hypothetical protein
LEEKPVGRERRPSRKQKRQNLILNFAFVFGNEQFEIGFDRSAFAARRRRFGGGSLVIRIET